MATFGCFSWIGGPRTSRFSGAQGTSRKGGSRVPLHSPLPQPPDLDEHGDEIPGGLAGIRQRMAVMGHTMNHDEGGGTKGGPTNPSPQASKSPPRRNQKGAEEPGGSPERLPAMRPPEDSSAGVYAGSDRTSTQVRGDGDEGGFSLSAELLGQEGPAHSSRRVPNYQLQAQAAKATAAGTPAGPSPEAPPRERRASPEQSPKLADAAPPPPLELRAPARRKKKAAAPMPDITSREWQNSIADSLLSAKVPKTASSNTYSIKADFNTSLGNTPSKAAAPAAPGAHAMAMTHPSARGAATSYPLQQQPPEATRSTLEPPKAEAGGPRSRRGSREEGLGDQRASGLLMDDGVAGSLFPGRDMVRLP